MIADDAFQGDVPFGSEEMDAVQARLRQLKEGGAERPAASHGETISLAHVLSVSPSLGWMAAVVPASRMTGDHPSYYPNMHIHQTCSDQDDEVVDDVYDHVERSVLNRARAFVGSLMTATGFTGQLVPLMALYAVYAHDDQTAARWMAMAHDLDLAGDPIFQAAERLAERHDMHAVRSAYRNRVDAVVTGLLERGELDYTCSDQRPHAFTLADADTLADMMADCDQAPPDAGPDTVDITDGDSASTVIGGRCTDIFFNHDGMAIDQLRLVSLDSGMIPQHQRLADIIRRANWFTASGFSWTLMNEVWNWCRSKPDIITEGTRPVIIDDTVSLKQFHRMYAEQLQDHAITLIIINRQGAMEQGPRPAFHLAEVRHVATVRGH